MTQTYDIVLHRDHIEWPTGAPDLTTPVRARVTILESPAERSRRGERMAEALRTLADHGAFSEIEDPVAWQREQRTDRPDPRDG